MNVTEMTPAQLRQAASIQEKIRTLQTKLGQILGANPAAAPVAGKRVERKRRKMSAAGRAAIQAAQKARWAKFKAARRK